MWNQVRGFHRGVWKFIAKIQTTFPNCADINLCLHSYLFPSQAKLNSKSSDITIHMSDSKSSNILSDGSLNDILRHEN
jgi:hypothetical protein